MQTFIIKELVIGEEDHGIQAVSLVDEPAIEEDFIYFSKDVRMGRLGDREIEPGIRLGDFYQYTASPEPEIIDTSHDFCRQKAGRVYHISEINAWGNFSQARQKEFGFNTDNNFFKNFTGNAGSFNINQQIYNCRHWFRKVNNVNDIPEYKQKMFADVKPTEFNIEFKVSDTDKREIEGMALQSGQFIYRNDISGLGPGYVFFTRDTIRKLKEKYGFNRNLTIQHSHDITGTAILMDSWLVEKDDENKTEWFLKYKIINDQLWEVIKNEGVKGYSIEGLFDLK